MILKQLEIMRKNLYQFHGVGIASVQCAEILKPLKIVIVGTNDNSNLSVPNQRYPDYLIPNEQVLINPKITFFEGAYYPITGEGCLSVEGNIRGQVKRYKKIKVEYFDENGLFHKEELKDMKAHIAQHELDHLEGKVYLQIILMKLTNNQKKEVENILDEVINRPSKEIQKNNNPILSFIKSEAQGVIVDKTLLKKAALSSPVEILKRILNEIKK